MSTSMFTAVAAATAFATILLLVVADVRKPARPGSQSRRGRPAPPPMAATAVPTLLYRPPRLWQRLRSLVGLGAMAALIGFVLAATLATVLLGTALLLREAVG